MVGLTTVDVMHVLEGRLGADAKTTAQSQFVAAGGPAANAAVAAAGLGATATLVTALGGHPLAELARSDLQRCGVEVIDLLADQRVTAAPPLSLIRIVPATGERSVSSLNDGALSQALPAVASSKVAQLIEHAGCVLIDGYYPQILTALHDQLAAHRQLLIDLGSWKSSYAPLLPGAHLVAASADAKLPTGEPLLAGLLAAGVSIAMRTNGPHPVRYATAESSGQVSVPRIDAVDTLGAGDVFHGALCAARAFHPSADPATLASFAAAVAARKAASLGPRNYLTGLEDLQLPHCAAL